MGIPAAEIDRWPESELRRYIHYANRHLLPKQRLEYYLAQTAYVSAAAMGGFEGGVTDFMLKTGDDSDTEEETEAEDEADGFAELDAFK